MKSYRELSEQPHIGDIVQHISTGKRGEIIEITTEDVQSAVIQTKVTIRLDDDSKEKPKGINLVLDKYGRYDSNSFEVQKRTNKAALKKLSEKKPLRLLRLVLIDQDNKASIQKIREELTGPNLLNMEWIDWWQRLQPLIVQTNGFDRDGHNIKLLTLDINKIPEMALPPLAPKRTSMAAKSSASEFESLFAEIEFGKRKWYDVNNEDRTKLAKMLVDRKPKSAEAESALKDGLASSNYLSLVKALIDSKYPGDFSLAIGTILDRFDAHLQIPGNDQAEIAKYPSNKDYLEIAKKINGRKIISDSDLQESSKYLDYLIEVGMNAYKHKSKVGNESLYKASALITDKDHRLFNQLIIYLSSYNKQDVAMNYARQVLQHSKWAKTSLREKIDSLLKTGDSIRPEFIADLVSTSQNHINVSDIIAEYLPERKLLVLIALLQKNSTNNRIQHFCDYLATTIKLAALSKSDMHQLVEIVADGIIKYPIDMRKNLNNIYYLISLVSASETEKQNARWNQERNQLNNKIVDLEKENDILRNELHNQVGLKVQARLQEHTTVELAAYQARLEVLKHIINIYQTAFMNSESGILDYESTKMLSMLKAKLPRFGLKEYGNVGHNEPYKVKYHEYIPGERELENDVVILCPGFTLQMPDSTEIIFKSKVKDV